MTLDEWLSALEILRDFFTLRVQAFENEDVRAVESLEAVCETLAESLLFPYLRHQDLIH